MAIRVCFIADGNSVFTRRWLEPLAAAGHEVALLSYTSVDPPAPVANTVDLTAIANVRKLRFVVWALVVRRFLRRFRPDLLHAHQLVAAGWLAAASGFHPFVASAWGSDLLLEQRRGRLRRALLGAVLHRCDALTVPSAALATAARGLGVPAATVHEIPWGIEEDVFVATISDREPTRERLGLPRHAFVVLSPRRIAWPYNHEIAVDAFAAAFAGGEARLVLLAAGAERDVERRLRERVHAHGLAGRTLWLAERLDLAGMAALYRAADVTLSLPSSEGYGATVREAMACGCPTVIGDLPAFAGELADGVHTLKVPVGDAIATAAALRRLAGDGELRERLRRAGCEVARRDTAAGRVARVERLYRRLVDEAHR